jgi:hypothetical protein
MTELNDIQAQLQAISDDANKSFGELTGAQLNWKPGADRWSVAQCLDHLITTNNTYEPVLKKVLSGDRTRTIWERLPLFPSLWARIFIKSLDPKSTRKLKAPRTFEPAQSELPESIVANFTVHQAHLIDQIALSESKQPERIVISSPAAKFITYTLLDAFRIVVVHEQRHLEQAKRVVAEPAFPKS